MCYYSNMKGTNQMQDLKGLTIKQALKLIKKEESNNTFQIAICERYIIKRDLKNQYKHIHQFNEKHKRVYYIRTIERRYYAINEDLESNNIVIDSLIEQAKCSDFYISGKQRKTYLINAYVLIVEHLQKGNKGTKRDNLIESQEIEYKDNELTKAQRRFTL